MDSGKRKTIATERRRGLKMMQRVTAGLRLRLDDALRGKHVTFGQLRMLMELKVRPGQNGAQVARACGVTPQSAQAMLVRAVQHGWVVRGTDAENSRVFTARLTGAGERLLVHADAVFTLLEEEVWAGVTMAELRGMNALLERALSKL